MILAPAMNGKMYEHEAMQKNLKVLKERGVEIIEPVIGELACGYQGIGNLAPTQEILARVETYFDWAIFPTVIVMVLETFSDESL